MPVNRKKMKKVARFTLLVIGIAVGFFFLFKFLPFGYIHYPFFSLYSRVYTEYLEPFFDGSEGIMIIAPHCDDETMAAGGVIQQAINNGKAVKVVFITSGDGFGTEYEGGIEENSFPRGVGLGYLRQREAVQALETLGLMKENIIFLGYPDKGIDRIWKNHHDCDNPYISPFTQSDRSPYLTSFTMGAYFCAPQVIDDLIRILDAFQPGTIYLPSPYDLHPDHHATYAFTREAMEILRGRGTEWVEETIVYLYLIHYGRLRWPPQWGYAPRARLTPPRNLLGVRPWTTVELTLEEVALKKEALESYQSQSALREFLLAFARRNETFMRDQNFILPPESSIVIPDSRREATLPIVVRGGDIQNLTIARFDNTLEMILQVDSGVPIPIRYRFSLVGYRNGEVVLRETYRVLDRNRIVRERGETDGKLPEILASGKTIGIRLDLDADRFPQSLLLSAESLLPRDIIADRLPWSLVIFAGE